MKMQRTKLIGIVLVLTIIFTLTGCSGDAGQQGSSDAPDVTSGIPTISTVPSETPSASNQPAGQPSNTEKPQTDNLKNVHINIYNRDTGDMYSADMDADGLPVIIDGTVMATTSAVAAYLDLNFFWQWSF